jgi:hypothetical protein
MTPDGDRGQVVRNRNRNGLSRVPRPEERKLGRIDDKDTTAWTTGMRRPGIMKGPIGQAVWRTVEKRS